MSIHRRAKWVMNSPEVCRREAGWDRKRDVREIVVVEGREECEIGRGRTGFFCRYAEAGADRFGIVSQPFAIARHAPRPFH